MYWKHQQDALGVEELFSRVDRPVPRKGKIPDYGS
jgi:hypothetical protein